MVNLLLDELLPSFTQLARNYSDKEELKCFHMTLKSILLYAYNKHHSLKNIIELNYLQFHMFQTLILNIN